MNDRLLPLLQDAADFLSGRSALGTETSRAHSWPWPPSVTIVLLLAAAALIITVYVKERSSAGRFTKTCLAAIRLALVALVLFMMYGWMLHRHRTELPDIVVVLDDSESMLLPDHYDDAPLRSRLAKRLQQLGLPELSRFNLAKSVLFDRDGALLSQLRQQYNLKFYVVGGSARLQTWEGTGSEETQPQRAWRDGIQSLEAHETASRLGKGLRDILEAQRGRPTAAVIMFTDGVTTEGKTIGEVAEYVRRKTVPLYLVGLGNDKPPRDLRLSDLLVDDVVFVGDQVNFDFKVTGSGYEGQRVTVRLLEKGRESQSLAQDTLTLGKDSEPQSARLSYRPTAEGDFEYGVEVQPLEGEANLQNNRQTRLVKVRDETLRVLLVQEQPSYEFRFLKNALGRELKRDGKEKAIALTTVLQEADLEYAELDETAARVFPVSRDELFAFDVLIFGDTNPAYLSRSVLENIVAFVEERGGGLIVVSGPRHTPLAYRESPLAKLLPIDVQTASIPPPDAVLDKSLTIQPTRLGLSSPQLQLESTLAANLRVWRSLPGCYWMLQAPDLRPGTRVLAEDVTRTGAAGSNLPVICVQFVGAGKVVFHATDETYRWSRHPDGEKYYTRYWMQTLRYLSRSKLLEGSRAAELTSDREEYRRGESVRLRVRFFDDRLAPARDDDVTIMLEREGSQRRQIKLHRDAVSRGIFEGAVSNLAEGSYNAWVATPTLPGKPASQRFTVVAPPGEQARLELDAADLQQAAKVTQGKYYTIRTADQLVKDLPRGRQVRIESLPPTPIWNSSLWAGLFVALILTEWLWRKKAGML
ncbi:MAG: hypothetical protein NTY19_49070 [Planctomycetota bacterium]|nr:hypothetical protein [Planctomycetota bacterium]